MRHLSLLVPLNRSREPQTFSDIGGTCKMPSGLQSVAVLHSVSTTQHKVKQPLLAERGLPAVEQTLPNGHDLKQLLPTVLITSGEDMPVGQHCCALARGRFLASTIIIIIIPIQAIASAPSASTMLPISKASNCHSAVTAQRQCHSKGFAALPNDDLNQSKDTMQTCLQQRAFNVRLAAGALPTHNIAWHCPLKTSTAHIALHTQHSNMHTCVRSKKHQCEVSEPPGWYSSTICACHAKQLTSYTRQQARYKDTAHRFRAAAVQLTCQQQ
ncbi:hypothetical protein COO60DRAFT_238543 [Scenedesmus sp. NREL 46B-D3]|nr:hypothetical protein COO60DRAFT_238543 [Scenedesmus sp. NREL 46B-D3]